MLIFSQSSDLCFGPGPGWVRQGAGWVCGAPRGDLLTMNASMGLKELVDALFAFEIRYRSEVLCLQAATKSPVPILLLHNLSVLLVREFIVPTFPQILSILKGAVIICFWQAVFTVICSTPGLTVLLQDLPSGTGQKVHFLSQEKMSIF